MNADAIDKILADFRGWLMETPELPTAEPAPALDVATVVQQFTALRQEVNLQTKSSRAQLEQNAAALAALEEALAALKRQPQDDRNSQDEALRPLLKTLIDAHDALALAQREVRRMLENAPEDAPAETRIAPAPPAIKLRLPYWSRWFGLDASIDAQLAPLFAWAKAQSSAPGLPADESGARHRQALDALLVGYTMSLQRLERAFDQHDLEAIACVGEPFDPETMEVAEVVHEEGRDSTEVIQEIRRGYFWRGKLFRYAQVRVAKP